MSLRDLVLIHQLFSGFEDLRIKEDTIMIHIESCVAMHKLCTTQQNHSENVFFSLPIL